ncbi:MAG TPA: glycosyltransferase, partial [Anaeromyxobacteraceae bacterium]|nr:glycosyltransferase [Anaeromyxobacteraceae bacterium]
DPCRSARMTSLSVLVPVYNEEHLVAASLGRLGVLETSGVLSRIQVIVVDDGSRDATAEELARFRRAEGLVAQDGGPAAPGATLRRPGSKLEWIFVRHERNSGKGKAIQTALSHADCEISVIHDADLEYHPKDLLRIVDVFEAEHADAVFGSRFAGAHARRVLLFRHEIGNRLLTFLTNVATNLNLTDMETCYKAMRTDLLKSIPLVSNDFRIEPELTIKLAKREARIFEVPISYSGRGYQDGKKIGWRDGVRALGAIARFSLSDAIYARDAYGSAILARLARAPRFNAWMADVIRPFCGSRVLEIGSGTGNLTRRLTPRKRYVASDVNPLYLQTLEQLRSDRPYLEARYCDVTDLESFPREEADFDTVVCLNVIEHVDDDRRALENLRAVLEPGGRAIVLVPHDPRAFGTLDEVLGHRRRYTEPSLRDVAEAAGFEVERIVPFNRVGSPAWWLNGKLLRRRSFGLVQILALNALTPAFRMVDGALPFPPLSLVAVLRRPAQAPASADPRASRTDAAR